MSPLENVSDEELVMRIRRNDRDAFVEIVERYKKPMFQLAYRMLGDPGYAEDVAQETFLRVYENLDKFNVSKKFSSWIYRIATNLCIDQLRKQGKIFTQSTDQPVPGTEDFYPQLPSQQPAPDTVAVQHQLQATLQSLIEELPPKYRAVIVLRYVEDLAYQDIADILEMPLGTVKTRLFRAREALRGRIEAEPALRLLVNELLDEQVLPLEQPETSQDVAEPGMQPTVGEGR